MESLYWAGLIAGAVGVFFLMRIVGRILKVLLTILLILLIAGGVIAFATVRDYKSLKAKYPISQKDYVLMDGEDYVMGLRGYNLSSGVYVPVGQDDIGNGSYRTLLFERESLVMYGVPATGDVTADQFRQAALKVLGKESMLSLAFNYKRDVVKIEPKGLYFRGLSMVPVPFIKGGKDGQAGADDE